MQGSIALGLTPPAKPVGTLAGHHHAMSYLSCNLSLNEKTATSERWGWPTTC